MLKALIRTAAVVVFPLVVVAATGAVAHADVSTVDCIADPTDPFCVVQVGTPGDSQGGGLSPSTCRNPRGQAIPCYIPGKGWLGEGTCYFQRASGTDLELAEKLHGKVAPPAYWYMGTCGDPLTDFWPAGLTVLRVFDTDPGVQLLAQEAVRQLRLPPPRIRLSPASPAPQVVLLPTWLWIDAGAWSPRSATASVAGLSVTAVGTPMSVTWSTGDGATVSCGRGTAWTAGMDPAKASPDCGHVYRTSSRSAPGGVFALSATITWKVTWSGGGATGTQPALTSTSTTQVRVAEAHIVNTQ